MHKPFFTIITVTYNSSKFVRDAIDSILASTFNDFELIIADDCSTDNTWEIINSYIDKRITKYRNFENIGEYSNRNKAIDYINGKWVLFIDGDDYIYPHALYVLYSILINDYDIAMAIMCPEMPNVRYPVFLTPNDVYEIEFSEHGFLNRALTHTVYKANSIKQSPFEILPKYYGLDTLNRLIILRNNNCLLINDNLTWWRRSANQISNNIHLSGVNEQYMFSYYLFSHIDCPLSELKRKSYFKNSKIKITRSIISNLLKLNYTKAIKIKNSNKIKWYEIFYIFLKLNKENPLLLILNKSK